MPRDGAIIFGDLIGKLDVPPGGLRQYGRAGSYRVKCRGRDAYAYDVDNMCAVFGSGDGSRARGHDIFPTAGAFSNRDERERYLSARHGNGKRLASHSVLRFQ
jgi:hypothetical protein